MNFNRFDLLIKNLCRLNAPSSKEEKVRFFIKDFLKDLDIESEEFFDCENSTTLLLLRIRGDKKGNPILLSSHLDSVAISHSDEIALIEENGCLKTDGSSALGGDDRLGVAICLLMAEKAALNPSSHSGLEILFTEKEERGCIGSSTFDFSTLESSFGYNLDGETPVGTSIIKAPKKGIFKVTIKGKSSHAALEPNEGINAILVASIIISKIPLGLLNIETTSNIGLIEGGCQTNVVPSICTFTGELRSFNSDSYDYYKREIENIIFRITESHNATYKIEFETKYEGYNIDRESEVVKLFQQSCKKIGLEGTLLESRGGGDSNNINKGGLSSIVFGLGMHNIHTCDEFFYFKDYHKAIELMDTILFNNSREFL